MVIPLNRSFCKYLNPINKVFSEGVQQTAPFRELTCCDSSSLFRTPLVPRVILINTTQSLTYPLTTTTHKKKWDSVLACSGLSVGRIYLLKVNLTTKSHKKMTSSLTSHSAMHCSCLHNMLIGCPYAVIL